VQCDDFAHFSVIDNIICGNCMALVPTMPFEGKCSKYCESFGHKCVFAAEEVVESCNVLARYACDETIADTSDMLCQCASEPEPSTRLGRCAPYSNWPTLDDGAVCGDCKALAQISVPNGSCDAYCQSFNHVCTDASNDVRDSCQNSSSAINCSTLRNNDEDLLCTCVFDQRRFTPRCASYSQWPNINELVCGDCEAVVSINQRTGNKVTSCSEFCSSFDHICQRAFRTPQPIIGDFCSDRGPQVTCSTPITGTTLVRCVCALPGVIIPPKP